LFVALFNAFPAAGIEWAARHNLNPTQYQAAFDDFLSKGYILKSLSGYTQNGAELYEALWVKNNGVYLGRPPRDEFHPVSGGFR
jgi:hypothetical protein